MMQAIVFDAHSLMVAGQLRGGERVLVVGAGGGVNTASIEIAKLAGAIGSTMGTQSDYQTVMDLVFGGRLCPIVDSVFPIDQFEIAMTRMLSDEMFGKIVIKVGDC